MRRKSASSASTPNQPHFRTEIQEDISTIYSSTGKRPYPGRVEECNNNTLAIYSSVAKRAKQPKSYKIYTEKESFTVGENFWTDKLQLEKEKKEPEYVDVDDEKVRAFYV